MYKKASKFEVNMKYKAFVEKIYELNEDEKFYKKYAEQKREGNAEKFISKLKREEITKRHLIIEEIDETFPASMRDIFFLPDKEWKVRAMRHNRFSPVFNHYHDYYEVIYVYSGFCEQYVEGKSVPLRSGDICVVPPGVAHSIGVFDESVVINVVVAKDYIKSILLRIADSDLPIIQFLLSTIGGPSSQYIIYRTGNDEQISSLFLQMLWEGSEKGWYSNRLSVLQFETIFTYVIRGYRDSYEMEDSSNEGDLFRQELLRYLNQHYKEANLTNVAQHYNYSPEYLSRLVKQKLDINFAQILQYIRVEQAKGKLLSTKDTVDKIAKQVGFQSGAHFNRIFKQYAGMTPLQFRNQMR